MPTIEEIKEQRAAQEREKAWKLKNLRKELRTAIDAKTGEESLKAVLLKAGKGMDEKSGFLKLTSKFVEKEMEIAADNEDAKTELILIQMSSLVPSLDAVISAIQNGGNQAQTNSVFAETLFAGGKSLYSMLEALEPRIGEKANLVSTLSTMEVAKSSPEVISKLIADTEDLIGQFKWVEGKYKVYQEASGLFAKEYHLEELPFMGIEAEATLSVVKKANKKGCFVATACYGNYEAKEVRVLRMFRDSYLESSGVGREMVRFYYGLGPSVANFLDRHPGLKGPVRIGLLGPIVKVVTFLPRTKSD